MPTRGRHLLSLSTALALWGVLLVVVLLDPPRNILSWDTFGYHLYLPATIIHGDPGISDPAWVTAANDTYHNTGTLYQISELPNGRWVDKYPMGLAMLWSPFFLAGHVVAGITGAPQDGFSAPYQWSLIIAALLSMLFGLLLVRGLLIRLFHDGVVALVLLLLVLGTNYYHQATQGTGMPHVFLFTLGAAVLRLTVLWNRSERQVHAWALGAVLGLLVAARPTEIVWVLVPLCYGNGFDQGWHAWFSGLWSRRRHLVIMALAATLVCFPQLLYWKWMTGRWLYMSYNNAGEGFEFLHPYLAEVLFSFRKGWYLYTPLMLLATAGIALLWKRMPEWRWPVLLFFALNLYIVSSWSCWWYADSFGQRALVQSYALMALPLAALVEWVLRRARALRAATLLALLGCVALNLFQTWQVNHGIIHTSRMTAAAYRAGWLKTEVPEGFDRLLLFGRSYQGANDRPKPSAYRRLRIAHLLFDSESGSALGLMTGERPFTSAWRIRWQGLTRADHAWIEVRGRARAEGPETPEVSLVTTMEHNGHSYGYVATGMEWAAGQAQLDLEAWYLPPDIRRPDDELLIYGWSRGAHPARLTELDIFIHEPLR